MWRFLSLIGLLLLLVAKKSSIFMGFVGSASAGLIVSTSIDMM